MYTLPELPYKYDALEPYIDQQTMMIHHDKHHQAYIDKLNVALEGHDDLADKSIDNLLRGIDSIPEDVRTAIRNHGGGHANHSLFWNILGKPEEGEPSASLASKIDDSFGSFTDFQVKFADIATAQFGSGWAWLVVTKDGSLDVYATANQDSPYMQANTPILGLDVWEHAYYLKYQNKRPSYITAFWNVVNWNEVERLYAGATV